ncbi:MAG TPA: class I SAM-dependent methyltransferase [Bryobacterales bacterium]|nr:class I SAM-dependent methyltransferase [Bryobacterales bacterium]
MSAYSDTFYARQGEGSISSARRIVPLVIDLIAPKSVVDVGCGLGSWIAVFMESGIRDVLGIDGPWVRKEMLHISPEHFQEADLARPLTLDRGFDLVVSLEVAEHLPASAAQTFINSLTAMGPAVLFSAAIPFQGGIYHLNEQWQSYWAEMFMGREYVPVDCIRPVIWNDPDIKVWYAQNTVLYIRQSALPCYPRLKSFSIASCDSLSLVHPRLYLGKMEKLGRELQSTTRLGTLFAESAIRRLPGAALAARVVRSLRHSIKDSAPSGQ